MSRRKPEKRYFVYETPKGGKRRRRCHGSTGTKAEAQRFQKAMQKNFGDRFTYRLGWEWV